MTDYAALTDEQLNEAAAKAMGLEPSPWAFTSRMTLFKKPGEYQSRTFEPATDLNHAAELGAAFLAAWPDYYIMVYFCTEGGNAEVLRRGVFNADMVRVSRYASEARARTVAVLQAWDALGAG